MFLIQLSAPFGKSSTAITVKSETMSCTFTRYPGKPDLHNSAGGHPLPHPPKPRCAVIPSRPNVSLSGTAAFRNGDRYAVEAMYAVLSQGLHAERSERPGAEAVMRQQMEAEFGIRVMQTMAIGEAMRNARETATREEVELAQAWMDARGDECGE